MRKQNQIETCFEHFTRQLKEGWRCISLNYPFVLLAAPGPEKATKLLDLSNDVETLRPNAAGDLTEITYQFPASGAHWDKVDEATPDDNTTRVYIDQTASILTDLFNLPAHSGVGTINSVVIYARAAAETNAIGKLRIMHKTHGTLYQSSEVSLTTSWTTYSTTHTTNPNTSSAWTWAEIDALQVGAKILDGNEWYEVGVTQVYVEVNYEPIIYLAGTIDVASTVEGGVSITKQLAGTIIADTQGFGDLLLENGDDLLLETGDNILWETHPGITGSLTFVASTRGFYYSKLGTDNLINPPKTSFSITSELNSIADFSFTIQNNAANRTIIADHLTEDFKIMRDDDTILLTGSIDSGDIEYFAEGDGGAGKRIRLSGYANFVDLAYKIYKRMMDGDAEDTDSVQDEDNSTSTFTDYTTEANNATINDVLLTFGAVNDALYVGKTETFFSMKIKYSTKGIQAANTTVIVEYSKGSGVWATLDCIDESYAFTKDAGTYLFYLPNKADDWAKNTVNSVSKYWLRFRLTEGSYSTLPKLDQIKLSNTDVCRVQFNEVAADTILGYLLEGTGYTEDATDQCPSTPITIRGEYDTILRWIFGLGSALTWEDGDGDKQRYDCWIDPAQKVHYKQHRGTDKGDISAEFRAVNNKMGYEEIGTRIFGVGGQEGINQKRAIVEDLTAQGEHQLREIVVEDNKITTYEALKEHAQKSLADRKAPLKGVSGVIDTQYWLDASLAVGDKITVHQPDWNLNNQELYIMRAAIGPASTNLDLGTSQMHLEHMRSSLQRQMDIDNVWMHGTSTTYVIGPEDQNFEREDDTTVHPVRMTIEVPSNARGINHVEISWTLSDFLSSVKGSEDLPAHNHTIADSGDEGAHDHTIGASTAGGAHDHTIGASTAGGAHDHTIGVTVSGGAHDHDTVGAGDHNHLISSDGAHTHGVTINIGWSVNNAVTTITGTSSEGNHEHTIGNTGYDGGHTHGNSGTGSAGNHTHGFGTTSSSDAPDDPHSHTVDNGVESGGSHSHSVSDTDYDGDHVHGMPDTGWDGAHTHSVTKTTAPFVDGITYTSGYTTTQFAAHDHDNTGEPVHSHDITIEVAHAHSNPNTATKPAHAHSNPNTATKPAHAHNNPDTGTKPDHKHTVPDTSAEPGGEVTLKYGIYNAASGDALELLINDEKVGDFVGSQTGINITGWVTTGNNSVELQPKISDNVKGHASVSAIATVFLETLK